MKKYEIKISTTILCNLDSKDEVYHKVCETLQNTPFLYGDNNIIEISKTENKCDMSTCYSCGGFGMIRAGFFDKHIECSVCKGLGALKYRDGKPVIPPGVKL